MDIDAVIKRNPVIPVVVLDDAKDAGALADALLAGGITTAEVTFRTTAAASAIAQMSQHSDILVGAGTVTNLDQARTAVDSGAKYLVMPGYDQDIVDYCQANNVPVLPGATDASWLMKALNSGLRYVKFFPAEASGGLPVISALSGPFPQMQFVPTGGISIENLAQYLAHPQVAACGGSWIATRQLIAQGDFSEITARAAATLEIAATR
ncbi:2-dehydro-3-deoxyphosphogluconate aldolase/4-hydroxy-2-oxoglutarate aldolase [Mobiluncus holmesii ATCC 35242]|uniref:2-dehydro-3-deoxy-phosphogluconate aldolase n=1 Tax=Mobiluncus holmesii ATCC 35242 TaxID=887899 RepID=E6M5Z0_9ACTO|nr:bifunctional 4-hydroxy-2-oxoglutarate aldolase/2-dehydro-3-deoxy-phosphogluconate aldolase [Mobiluncus holmesii]EFU81159.1 2-dehydro-3-deoxyphosphogluconate aldolase/4-hydroxy-2-oxoglutarate aldolase [Mobiluncus holmesii ATCC 35242]STY89532.1 Putative KHG/KDPG aldolase [Mobiluncus holmesii]